MRIFHTMNTAFGRADQYGARSARICASEAARYPVVVFARGNAAEAGPGEEAGPEVRTVKLPYRYQALRYSMALLRAKSVQRRAIGRGFDLALRDQLKLETMGGLVLHTWEWIPESIRLLRERNPDLKVVRDVVVNRFREFYSGVPITEEEKVTDLFLSPSAFSTSCLLEWGIPERKIFELPFGVDAELFRPTDEKTAGPLRFCFSGGVSARKGVDSLLRVWKSLDLRDAELHLYGRIRDDVRRELRGAKNVKCHGHVPLAAELPKNDAYVFPSTLEGSAKSVYEALACGLPVITTPNAGSVVRHGIDGLIVPAGDDEALREAVLRLYRDHEFRVRCGRAARQRAEEYGWDRYARGVWAAYDRLLDDRGVNA